MYKQKPCSIRRRITVNELYCAYRETIDGNSNTEGDIGNFWEAMYMLDGQAEVTSGTGVYILRKGSMILHRPMEFRRITAFDGESCEVATVAFAGKINIGDHDRVFAVNEASANAVKEIIDLIHTSFECSGRRVISQTDPYAQIAVNRLENYLLSAFENVLPTDRFKCTASKARKYGAIMNCLNSNVEKDLNISDIAKICKMSQSSVKQVFSRYTGTGVAQFYRRMKIDVAITRLENGENVRSVSDSLGFSDPNYFSTVFKRITGYNPTDFAKRAHSLYSE